MNNKCLKVLGFVVCAAVLVFASVASAADALLGDLESGTNQNSFGYYWYYYADGKDGGNTSIANSTMNADFTFADLVPMAPGNTAGTAGKCVTMNFKMGDKLPKSGAYTYPNFCGVGTMLCAEGDSVNLTGATGFSFYAKASANMMVHVQLGTKTVTDFCYHETEVTIGTSWTKYTVLFADLVQPSWGKQVKLDISKATLINWQVSVDNNPGLNKASGSFYLDDVYILNYTFVPDDVCADCVKNAGTATGAMLSNFDLNMAQNALGYYGYCYNDAEGRTVSVPGVDYSAITTGVEVDPSAPTKPILMIAGKKGFNSTEGAEIGFKLGPTYTQGTNTVKPFVGIGTGLTDDAGINPPFNAAAIGGTGVYFDYKTSATIDYIRLEVKHYPAYTNAGIVHYILLPGTAGAWKGASVPFTKLVLPKWKEVQALSPTEKLLKTNALTKIQLAFQSNPGIEGTIAIDNIYILGASQIAIIPVVGASSQASQSFIAYIANNQLTFAIPHGMNQAQVNLYSPLGKCLISQSVNSSIHSAAIPANTPAGNYIVRLTGEKGSHTAKVMLLK